MGRFWIGGWIAIATVVTTLALPVAAAAFPSNTHANPWLVAPPPDCPVTIPNNQPPPGRDMDINSGWHHGNSLWVGLPLNGVHWNYSNQLDENGYIWDKMVWVRESLDWPIHVTGFLRSDPSVEIVLQLPSEGDQAFVALQGMAVGYPQPGCWELTGNAGPHSLTVVIWVTTINLIAGQ